MKNAGTKNNGYVEGDTVLHKLKPETKIIGALFLLLGSGIGNGWALALVGALSVLGVLVARVPVKKILHTIRRMAWFFLVIAIFPVLFTPGFYIDLPAWFPFTVSREGLALGLESTARLLNILFISLVLVRTTTDWMGGLDKILGPMSQRLPIIRDLLAVSVMAVKFLPMIFAETEQRFSGRHKNEDEHGLKKLRSMSHDILEFVVSIFSDIDRFQSQINTDGHG